MRVLGVDPGLTRCGLGVVDGAPGRPLALVHVERGPHLAPTHDIGARLLAIERAIEAWLDAHRPDAVAVERVFSQHNVRTVMGTAQASAVAIAAAARRGLPVALHTPSEVKAAVTGNGRADKAQVGGDGDPAAAARRGARPGGRRRRAGAGDLPRLARRRRPLAAGRHPAPGAARRAGPRRSGRAGDRLRPRPGRRRWRRTRRSSRSAASASRVQCTPRHPRRAAGRRAGPPRRRRSSSARTR